MTQSYHNVYIYYIYIEMHIRGGEGNQMHTASNKAYTYALISFI
jgi:hypothetical protein